MTMQTVVQVQATRFAEMFARFLIAAAFVLVCSASTVEAMPFQSDQSFDILVLSIADKCGIGSYRDANGVCRRKYLFGRTPRKQFYGSCGGVNAHRVCNFIGQCWMVCD